jgi:hypothetical protein
LAPAFPALDGGNNFGGKADAKHDKVLFPVRPDDRTSRPSSQSQTIAKPFARALASTMRSRPKTGTAKSPW